MSDITRIDQNQRRSRASVFGDLVFLAGQVADTKTADIAQQTREALAKVDDMLGRAGTDKSRLLSVQVWLKTMDDFDAMNAVYDTWVEPGNAPTRACGKVELADPGYRIEVIAIAARK
ncbi:RidA family protein [Bradyrhizobium manausense]|uniref:RidA family protein n=1 Tax=Bradyrhizobium TaxID=374 RepID=UPI001BABD0AB|nr:MULTISPECIES: RidA family protein [Bradyrhizobium]MBR0830071.1 RidA family protein [Bradyrhizobium manausense]UVO30951.1 RidA family protein [Bradyrhizobium arachidis]